MNINVKIVLLYLLFFPSITFSLTQAEIFPWAIIFLIFVRSGIPKSLVVILVMFIISSVFTFYFTKGPFFEIIRSVAAYLNPLLIFYFILSLEPESELLQKFLQVSKHVFYFLFILGVLQLSNLIYFLNPIFTLLVPRGSSIIYGGGRGVLLLSSEPSRASYEFLFLFILFKQISEFSNRRKLYLDIGLILFQVIIIRSGTGLFLTSIYLLFVYGYRLLLLFSPLILVLSYITIQSRAFELAKSLITSVNFKNALYLVSNESGFRLISIFAGLFYGITHIFGGGIGNWSQSSVDAMKSLGIEAQNFAFFRTETGGEFFGIRPTSFLSSFTMDFGIIGLLLILTVLFKTVQKYWKVSYDFKRMLLFLFVFLLFFGDTGNPVPWIVSALVLKILPPSQNILQSL